MLPALTISRRRITRPRLVLATASVLLLVLATLTQTAAAPAAPRAPTTLAGELAPGSWALAVPNAWLAAPAPRLRAGDVLDILAVKQGDRAYTVPVALAVAVLQVDEHGLVLQVDEDDASAIAIARGGGLLLVPLLRSTR